MRIPFCRDLHEYRSQKLVQPENKAQHRAIIPHEIRLKLIRLPVNHFAAVLVGLADQGFQMLVPHVLQRAILVGNARQRPGLREGQGIRFPQILLRLRKFSFYAVCGGPVILGC